MIAVPITAHHVPPPELAAPSCRTAILFSRSSSKVTTTSQRSSYTGSSLLVPSFRIAISTRFLLASNSVSRSNGRKRNAIIADSSHDRETVSGTKDSDTLHEVIIVGGGVAGLATALALHKVGISSVVLERSSGPREGGAALSMWGNAWRALEVLGVAEGLRDGYSPLERVELCGREGKLLKSFTIQECVQGSHEVRGVHRGTLLAALAEPLPPNTIRYDCRPRSIREGSRKGTTEVELEDGSVITTKVLLGCDGARSSVATYLGLPPPNYAGYAACRGVADGPHDLGTTIRMVWGEGVRAGMYPLTDTKLYWFTCFNAPEDVFLGTKGSPDSLKEFALSTVKGWAYGVEEVIGRTDPQHISASNISDRWTLPLPGARWGRGGVTVLGDAAHPMTPNLGQGACTAIEDAVVLARELAGACNVVEEPTARVGIGRKGGGDVGSGYHAKGESEGGIAIFEEVNGSSGRRWRRVLGSGEEIEEALKRVDGERIQRTGVLSVRSNLMGVALQIPFAPICFVRDKAVPFIVNTTHFLDHALYDCGELPLL